MKGVCLLLMVGVVAAAPPSENVTAIAEAPTEATNDRELVAPAAMWVAKTVGGWLIGKALDEGFNRLTGTTTTLSAVPGSTCEAGCVPYPSKELAKFCNEDGRHSHKVHFSIVGDQAIVRDQSAKILWMTLKYEDDAGDVQDPKFKALMDSSSLCMAAVKDALCLDVFPVCDCTTETPCRMACNNIKMCLTDKGRTADARSMDCVQACGDNSYTGSNARACDTKSEADCAKEAEEAKDSGFSMLGIFDDCDDNFDCTTFACTKGGCDCKEGRFEAAGFEEAEYENGKKVKVEVPDAGWPATTAGLCWSTRTMATLTMTAYYCGCCGADRFYMGHTMYGILKLITVGGLLIWYIIDLMDVMGCDGNGRDCTYFDDEGLIAFRPLDKRQ